jgi:hypothetical protein
MQRKLTPLQRLRREFPFAEDGELQTELFHANGDVWIAIDRLSPPNSDLHDRKPPRRNTMPLEAFVKAVDKPMLSPQIMTEATPFSPADLPSNNPFRKLLLRHHEWQVHAYWIVLIVVGVVLTTYHTRMERFALAMSLTFSV